MRRDLVERAKAGDLEAFSELVRLSVDRLYAIARLILRDSARAEDATQEALLAAWRQLGGLRDPDRFEAWLGRLLVHACYRVARADGRRQRYEGMIRPTDELVGDPATRLADRDELERGFAVLTPEQRAILVLHYYVGLPLGDTADALGVPVGTVKSRLHRATQQMRATLDAEARTPLAQGQAT